MRVSEIMRKDRELPLCPLGTTLGEVLRVMGETPGRPGAALIVAPDGGLAGIFTDGDLRRLLEERGQIGREEPIDAFMVTAPKSVHTDALLEEAERLLREHKIDQMPVLDDQQRPVGLLDVQDILDTRF
jgi:arabinose-5-phosphate isomerase